MLERPKAFTQRRKDTEERYEEVLCLLGGLLRLGGLA
jgi:hypothetical protein